jgi:hypothetical protein
VWFCIYAFLVSLKTNIDHLLKQGQLVGVCNEDGVCLLRGKKQFKFYLYELDTSKN